MDIDQIGGVHIYYYVSCKRQLWLYVHYINMEQDSDRVRYGGLIHDWTYERMKKEITFDSMKIDFIDNKGFVHETKSSKYMKTEHEWQLYYYMYYLKNIKQMDIKGGIIHYPEINKIKELYLDSEKEKQVETMIENIRKICSSPTIPSHNKNIKLCKACSYYELCYI
ncbi:MAG: CRISPR-associated protein Cas4 [Clostridiales bacterium]|nr:CRISPR-associated protein Cas4 [Clostridiales bacterium]